MGYLWFPNRYLFVIDGNIFVGYSNWSIGLCGGPLCSVPPLSQMLGIKSSIGLVLCKGQPFFVELFLLDNRTNQGFNHFSVNE